MPEPLKVASLIPLAHSHCLCSETTSKTGKGYYFSKPSFFGLLDLELFVWNLYFQVIFNPSDLPLSAAEQKLIPFAAHFVGPDLQAITLALRAVLLNFRGRYPSSCE